MALGILGSMAALVLALALALGRSGTPPTSDGEAAAPNAIEPSGAGIDPFAAPRSAESAPPPVPPGARGLRLRGRLVEAATGLPGEANVSVALRAATERRAGFSIRTASDSDGSFEFDLGAEGAYEIALDRGPYRDLRALVDVRGPETRWDLAVEFGATLIGRVVTRSADGEVAGVGGARVVFADTLAALRREAASAEPDGAFSLRGLPEDHSIPLAALRVSKKGFFGVVPRRAGGFGGAAVATAGEPVTLEIVPAATISGRLVVAGPVVEGVARGEVALFPGMELGTVIDAFDKDTLREFGRVTLAGLVAASGPDGRFRLRGVPPLVGLTLEARDGERALATAALRPLLPGEALDLGDVALAACAAASGVVLDGAGEGAAGALVRAECASVIREAMADGAGRFVATGLEPGSVRFTARARSGAFAPPVDALLLPGERADSVVLRLAACGRIEGEVARPDGEPVAGAEVAAHEAGSRSGAPRRTTTDALGRFSIEGLGLDAAFDVEVRAAGFVARPARGIAPDGGKLLLVAWRSASLSGAVAGPASLGPVFLTVEPLEAGARGLSLALPRPGPFRADGLEPGGYALVARVDGVERARLEPLVVAEGAAESGLVVEIEPPERAASGTVTAGDGGRPLPGARLDLFARRDGVPLARFGATSDGAGRFAIALPDDAMPLGLVARAAGFGAASIALDAGAAAGGEPLVVRLEPGGRLVFLLVDSRDGRPVASRATAVAARSDAPVPLPIPLEGTAAGRFEADLEPGLYDVAVRADGHAATVVEDVAIAAGALETRRAALDPSPGGEGRCRAE